MDSQKLAAVFVELADTLVDDFDVFDTLHILTTKSVELLDVAAAGLLLTDEGDDLRLVVSSTEQARLLEVFQLDHAEGPCVDCYHTGRPVLEPRLEDARDRWPNFAGTATSAGFNSVIALPMRLRRQVIGGLNLFGTGDTRPIGDEDVRIAQSLADAATIAILQDRVARGRSIVNEQLQTALNTRVVVEQAKGVLSSHLSVTPDAAFEVLRSRARSTRRRLSDVAGAVVAGDLTEFTAESLHE